MYINHFRETAELARQFICQRKGIVFKRQCLKETTAKTTSLWMAISMSTLTTFFTQLCGSSKKYLE